MRKLFFTVMLVSTMAFCLNAQSLLPVTVQQFLEEQRYSEGFRKMDPSMRFVPPREVDGVEMVDAFIAIDSEYALTRLHRAGVIINSLFDGFVTAQIPMDILTDVCRMPGVTDVDISRRLKLCTDTTMHVTYAEQVLNGSQHGLYQDFDGSGVIVGVIDVGFDYQHRAFRSNFDTSRSRIVRVYNTHDNKGHNACYNKIIRLPGSVFMNDEIYGLTTDSNNSTHGTHTASIAAGSHVGGYGGMAPGSDIVLCAVTVLDGSMSAVEVANCVRYIDSYADSVGQPCVMSLSVSTPNGQHDGLDYLSRVVKHTTGPGRIFVISAGNDGSRYAYAHKVATPSNPMNLMFKCRNSIGGDSTYYYGGIIADVWMRKENVNCYYKFHVVDVKTGEIVWETEQLSKNNKIYAEEMGGYYKCYSADTVGYISVETLFASNGKKYHLDISLHNLISSKYTLVNGVRQSHYAIGMSVYPQKNSPYHIDAWSCNTGSRFGFLPRAVIEMDGEAIREYYSVPSDSCCIGTYAVGDSTISAGAYAARNSYYSMNLGRMVYDTTVSMGDIASFSSYQIEGAGPTGEALPTICAPGTNVVAAGSRYSYFARGSSNTVMQYDGSYWGVMSGTSMAAPTVAGIIALWLQADPTLSVSRVKDILAQTAIHDEFTSGPNHNRFGPNGKIDAMAGMEYVLKSIPPPFVLGDVNNDGSINISDVTDLVNYILLNYSTSSVFIPEAADLDGNGYITINDLILLINRLVNE
jgi:subtilisin family serine protease